MKNLLKGLILSVSLLGMQTAMPVVDAETLAAQKSELGLVIKQTAPAAFNYAEKGAAVIGSAAQKGASVVKGIARGGWNFAKFCYNHPTISTFVGGFVAGSAAATVVNHPIISSKVAIGAVRTAAVVVAKGASITKTVLTGLSSAGAAVAAVPVGVVVVAGGLTVLAAGSAYYLLTLPTMQLHFLAENILAIVEAANGSPTEVQKAKLDEYAKLLSDLKKKFAAGDKNIDRCASLENMIAAYTVTVAK